MVEIDSEIAAFELAQQELEAMHMGKWVLFHGGKLGGVFDSFEEAAQKATSNFGRGPYLIRQVGSPQVTLPASVMFNPIYD